ncbi:hypothetical protein BVX98_04650 [bacterium F11]|nr:hypothetical protein BVX98_04650 [bacterium F11]
MYLQTFFSWIKGHWIQFDKSPRNIYFLLKKHRNVVFFLAGFLFDAITIDRIDAWTDITIQIVYLAGLSFLLVYQYRANNGYWTPQKPWLNRLWQFNVEALHFLYGGLLSAYVILYLKSTSGARTFIFLLLLIFLLIINEMPQIRRFGYRLRLGLYAFCVSSFMIYFVAILIGRMGQWIFYLSLLISVALVWMMATLLAAKEENKKKSRIRLFLPAGGLFALLIVLYQLRLIPPVPLSIQYQGIFHHVLRNDNIFRLRYPKPPFYAFWRKDSQPFMSRPEDSIHYFTRIFAPSRFKTKVKVRWEFYDERKKKYITTDVIPLEVIGGRAEGFRGYVNKSNYDPGSWRVSTETQVGQTVGYVKFRVKPDNPKKQRTWVDLNM